MFNVLEDTELVLKHSKKRLSCSTLHGNPVILVGNYLLDTLPHDAFSVSRETLSEVTLDYQVPLLPSEPQFPSAALKGNTWRKRLVFPPLLYEDDLELDITASQLKEEHRRREQEDGEVPGSRPLPPEFHKLTYYRPEEYPEAERYNELLEKYRMSFSGGSGSILFPLGCFQMVERLIQTFGPSMLYLIGDKGDVDLSALEGDFPPHISIHGGSLSFMTNFHALSLYWREALEQSHILLGHTFHHFKVNAFVGGAQKGQLRELNCAFAEVNQFGPDDYHRVYANVNPKAKVAEIHAMMRLSCNDPGMFYQYREQLLSKLPRSWWKNVIIPELLRMWANYYHRVSSVEEDIPYSLGEIFLACERPDEALPFFKKSLKLSGNFYSTNYHIGVCYEQLGNVEEALSHYRSCDTAELDVEDRDITSKVQYLESVLLERETTAREEKEREQKRLAAIQQEKDLKQHKLQRALSLSQQTQSPNSSINPMARRMNKYGLPEQNSVAEEPANSEEEAEEDQEDEEELESECDDDFGDITL